jgi:RNA polymerase sigma-70 factor, ECF subfamily
LTNATQNPDWNTEAATIVRLIKEGDMRGEEMLYAVFTRRLRYLAMRKVGHEQADECVHDTFIIMVKRIKEGALREPGALLKYARTILERIIIDIHQERIKWRVDIDFDYLATTYCDNAPTPDRAYESSTRTGVMKRALEHLRPKEREILVRYYIEEQNPETIRSMMNLTENQYRLLKNRSKSKLERITSSYLQMPDSNHDTPDRDSDTPLAKLAAA